jgi:hypothetical protein
MLNPKSQAPNAQRESKIKVQKIKMTNQDANFWSLLCHFPFLFLLFAF